MIPHDLDDLIMLHIFFSWDPDLSPKGPCFPLLPTQYSQAIDGTDSAHPRIGSVGLIASKASAPHYRFLARSPFFRLLQMRGPYVNALHPLLDVACGEKSQSCHAHHALQDEHFQTFPLAGIGLACDVSTVLFASMTFYSSPYT